ncbi:hypothetical protein C8034_v006221 [Colletotrichum sidae]|uniref:Cysteine-rich transmembrane CYSTM domain-containing protein n=3 Tax=Colletotrichum orbiculare species complex TaxID=2707354 RepID=A0A4R8RVS8_COLTR|nr:hypothetical protein C8035_v008934 [Colletotrichum spinosum]TDZ71831.1 hypothetical protein CTRI78_v001662 [Colletotrichum trifolii]TEA12227.1 hypothetical protein C8034_v006221 [Colletotrichum sidae]
MSSPVQLSQMPVEPVPAAVPESQRRISSEQPRPVDPMTASEPMSLRGGKADGGAICCGVCAGLCCFECFECCCC